MSAELDVLYPDAPERVLLVASNPATSDQTGWPIGFRWAELTHPYWEFTEHGYEVDLASPEGGEIVPDAFTDPEDPSGYSAHDLISLGFKHSPAPAALLTDTRKLADVEVDEYARLRIQPFWIEERASALRDTDFVVHGRFKEHAVRDGNLITGQQQYSGGATARLVIEALGI